MNFKEYTQLSFSAVKAKRMRSGLTALGIAVGIATVVLLTSIGEGLHRYVVAEFSQFGTNLIGINPGKTTTVGFPGALINTVRPLTLEDSQALKRLPQVIESVPLIQGNAQVEAGQRQRRTVIYGVGAGVPAVWQFNVSAGQFLPDDDPRSARAFVVLGSKVKDELFGADIPLGEFVRIGGFRFRVIGIMESKGQMLGFDLDDAVYIPVSISMEMFNREGLMEIDVLYKPNADAESMRQQIKRLLEARHGVEDFSIITQKQMLEVLNSVLDILTFAVGGLGGISLLVGGVGILTIMTIAVKERTSEIGLLTALGAERKQILKLFLIEAIVLSAIGGILGLLLGSFSTLMIHWLVPAIPTHTPLHFVVLAEALAVFIGIMAGVMPARKAARMNPVDALTTE